MKYLYLSIALVFTAIFGEAQSLIAYNPQGTFFDWWSGDFQVPEVGTGTIDSCHIDIEIDGPIAHLKYHYWLRSIPDANQQMLDNDSLELRTSFVCDEAIVFKHIQMKMNDSIRNGRVISRRNALNIWDNLVYDPTPFIINWGGNCDPGLLIKDGNNYEFRAFPVGTDSAYSAYVTLEAELVLSKLNATENEFKLPLQLLKTSSEEPAKFTAILHLDSLYSALNMPAIWQDLGNRTYNLVGSTQTLENTVINFVRTAESSSDQFIFQSEDQKSMVISTFSEDLIDVPASTDFLFVIDVNDEEWQNHNVTETPLTVFEKNFKAIAKQLNATDRFKLIVQNGAFKTFNENWISADSTKLQEALSFSLENIGSRSNPLNAMLYAKTLLQNDNAQVILITSKLYNRTSQSSNQLKTMAERLEMKHRTDVLSLQTNSIGHSNFFDLTLYKTLAANTNGYAATSESLADQNLFAKLQLLEISRAENKSEASASTNENGYTSIFQLLDSNFSASDNFSFLYSSGEKTVLNLPASLHTHQLKQSFLSTIGAMKVDAESRIGTDRSVAYFERQSTLYKALTDFSALLVVEHDSQYNDTTAPEIIQFWPLSVDEVLTHSITIYPNPSSGIITVSSDENDLILTIKIYDLQGKVVKFLEGVNAQQKQLNLSDLPASIFILETITESGDVSREKLQISH